MGPSVCVVGSLNIDLVVKVPRLPRVGETVSGGVFRTFPGGKGANQAVAAARLGAQVTMVGRVGEDGFGAVLVEGLQNAGIDVRHVRRTPGIATGVALIGVDPQGQNLIMVAPGANAQLTPEDVRSAREAIVGAQVVLLQLEVPIPAVLEAARIARDAGAIVCLDPAPAMPLPPEFPSLVDVIHPNETEASQLTGLEILTVEDAMQAARRLRAEGYRVAVVKIGDRGAVYASAEGHGHVPAFPVPAVDATAAGDAFAAALGVALAEGRVLPEAVRFANAAGARKVTRMGAQSMPSRREVEELLR